MLKLEEENIGKSSMSSMSSMFTSGLSGLNTSDIVGTAGEKNIPYKQTVAQYTPPTEDNTDAIKDAAKTTKEDSRNIIALTEETNQLMKTLITIAAKGNNINASAYRAGLA